MQHSGPEYLTLRTGWFAKRTIRLEDWSRVGFRYGSASCCSVVVSFEHKTTGEILKGSVTYEELSQLDRKGGDAW